MTSLPKCSATTLKGTACCFNAQTGSMYCGKHQNKNMQSALPPTVENIVSEYTSPEEYKKLMELCPKQYTADKLFLKQIEGVPRDLLLLVAKAHNLIGEIEFHENQDLELAALSLAEINLEEFRRPFPDTLSSEDDIDETVYRELLFERIEDIKDRMYKSITGSDFWEKFNEEALTPELEQKLDRIDEAKESDSDEIKEQLMKNAYINFLHRDMNIHPTTNPALYVNELVPFFEQEVDSYMKRKGI